MKKVIFIILLFGLWINCFSQNKSVTIPEETPSSKGSTYVDMTFGSTDTIAENQTYWIEFTCKKNYPQMQDVYIDLDSISGTPGVTTTLYGKKFASDAYVQVGTPIVWYGTGDTAFVYSVTTANMYRYYKLAFVAGATEQESQIMDVQFKTWFTGGQLASTSLTDGTATFTSGALTGATTGAFSGNVTIGGTLINTGLITANGGLTLGASDNLVGSSTSQILMNSNKFTVDGSNGNTLVAGTLNVTGVTTATGKIAANGGINLATNSTVFWTKGGAVTAATSGTNTACSNGARWWSELELPYNTTITGLAYLVGDTGGTDSVVVQLCNSLGVEVATSRAVGEAADLVGTAAQFQSVAFTAPYAAVAGKYYVVVQFNGTTAKFRTYPIPGSKFIANTAAGTWGTKADITPGTTFVADKGPIIMTY